MTAKGQAIQTATIAPQQQASGLLQRKCACGNHTSTGGECEECHRKREGGLLQRVAASPGPVNEVPSVVHDVLHSPGQPLDAETRAFMEPRFGHDFSGVRVHTDVRAAESARAVNALAYTVGRDVVFGEGQHAPTTRAGRKLMAHELTHVVQQFNAPGQINLVPKLSLNTEPYSPYEREAETWSSRIEQGIRAPIARGVASQLQRCGRPAPLTRGRTTFHPGVMHGHSPTGRWSDVQAAMQRPCEQHLSEAAEDTQRSVERTAREWWERGRWTPPRLPRVSSSMPIECACAHLSPRATLEAARHGTMTARGLTLASSHIDHFLSGGADFVENVNDLVTRDSHVREKLTRAMRQHSRGHIRISQGDYAVTDFQFAFGAIDRMDYEIDWATSTVHIWFMDRYEWHPVGFGYSHCPDDGPGRPTNCVHAAGVELKASGAADYWMVGDGVVPLSLFSGVTSRRRRRR